jgi:hypothetical protein
LPDPCSSRPGLAWSSPGVWADDLASRTGRAGWSTDSLGELDPSGDGVRCGSYRWTRGHHLSNHSPPGGSRVRGVWPGHVVAGPAATFPQEGWPSPAAGGLSRARARRLGRPRRLRFDGAPGRPRPGGFGPGCPNRDQVIWPVSADGATGGRHSPGDRRRGSAAPAQSTRLCRAPRHALRLRPRRAALHRVHDSSQLSRRRECQRKLRLTGGGPARGRRGASAGWNQPTGAPGAAPPRRRPAREHHALPGSPGSGPGRRERSRLRRPRSPRLVFHRAGSASGRCASVTTIRQDPNSLDPGPMSRRRPPGGPGSRPRAFPELAGAGARLSRLFARSPRRLSATDSSSTRPPVRSIAATPAAGSSDRVGRPPSGPPPGSRTPGRLCRPDPRPPSAERSPAGGG